VAEAAGPFSTTKVKRATMGRPEKPRLFYANVVGSQRNARVSGVAAYG
jgi:hypothetical protein